MKRHVILFNEAYRSPIGKGSVLLIKGKPETDGRRLYATRISGHAEIKPGLFMVFLNDEIYRVIHKGDGNMAGRRVDIRNEEALKGVLNLRNEGNPSIVLNHNKTPFHWMTLKHLDIGSALRELGPRLFSHDLILESEERPIFNPIETKILNEGLKAICGEPSMLRISNIDRSGSSFLDTAEDLDEDASGSELDWELILYLRIDESAPGSTEFRSELESAGIIAGVEDFLSDFLEVKDEIELYMMLETSVSYNTSYDPGDYYNPPEYDEELNWIENDITYIGVQEEGLDIPGDTHKLSEESKALLELVMKKISDFEGYQFDNLIKK